MYTHTHPIVPKIKVKRIDESIQHRCDAATVYRVNNERYLSKKKREEENYETKMEADVCLAAFFFSTFCTTAHLLADDVRQLPTINFYGDEIIGANYVSSCFGVLMCCAISTGIPSTGYV